MNVRASVSASELRCAVYTRKSSDEGLEQSFNSLHAQREACEAYIKSQVGEGWVLVPTAYDDGGFSGGDMDRPGLKQLLADVAAGLVNVVVVYKVDRLTRSLGDFARIVETFDRAGASFVSVTQAFNTTSSMGRLTLNVLLSFAQFEREVTGERIRDKIAASKAKGMWMGGVLPLGYDSKDRVLVVNEEEAEKVRHIFTRYLRLGSVHALRAELEKEGVRSKAWVTSGGRSMGGKSFSRGALFHLLQNRHYIGEIVHKDEVHPGLHAGIVDRKLFDAVQRKVARNRVVQRRSHTRAAGAALTGRIFDADGRPLSPTFSYGKQGRLYRYYVAADLQQGRDLARHPDTPRRLPADPLEVFVVAALRRLADHPLGTWEDLEGILHRVEVRPSDTHLILLADPLFRGDHPDLALEDLRGRLSPGERAVEEWGHTQRVRVTIPHRLQFRGGRTWKDRGSPQGGSNPLPDPTLVAALRHGHETLAGLGAAHDQPTEALIHARAPDSYRLRLCRLAFLAPDLQLEILEGRQPAGVTLKTFLKEDVPVGWEEQRRWWSGFRQQIR